MRLLATDLCTLEPQVEAHAHEMYAVLSDPAIYEFEREPPLSPESLAERFRRLESRRSVNGREIWLNWVVRVPSGQLTGYVQATIPSEGLAFIAYEFASQFWRQGLATAALRAMLTELVTRYNVTLAVAVLKRANYRSLGLLRKLSFEEAKDRGEIHIASDHDEVVWMRSLLGAPGPERRVTMSPTW